MKMNNPFRMIDDIEKGKLESGSMGMLEALAIGISYILLLNVFRIFLVPTSLGNATVKLVLQIGVYILILIIVLTVYRDGCSSKKENCEELKGGGRVRVSYRMLAAVMLLSLGILLSCFAIIYFTTSFIDNSGYMEMMKTSISNSSAFLFYGIVTGPICEEFVFRGIILNGMLKKYSKTKAILITAFIFGFIHLNIPQFIVAFIFGVFAGILYAQSKSLVACIFLHCTFNLINFVIMIGSDYKIYDHLQQMEFINVLMIGSFGMAVIYVTFRIIKKENRKRKLIDDKSEGIGISIQKGF
jgi:uncharacterized protein